MTYGCTPEVGRAVAHVVAALEVVPNFALEDPNFEFEVVQAAEGMALVEQEAPAADCTVDAAVGKSAAAGEVLVETVECTDSAEEVAFAE